MLNGKKALYLKYSIQSLKAVVLRAQSDQCDVNIFWKVRLLLEDKILSPILVPLCKEQLQNVAAVVAPKQVRTLKHIIALQVTDQHGMQ